MYFITKMCILKSAKTSIKYRMLASLLSLTTQLGNKIKATLKAQYMTDQRERKKDHSES